MQNCRLIFPWKLKSEKHRWSYTFHVLGWILFCEFKVVGRIVPRTLQGGRLN